MLRIKLTRLGKKAEPRYRIVVNEKRDKRDGKYVAALGYYEPAQQPKKLEIDLKEYAAWLKKGAQPTPTVAFLAKIVEAGKGFPEGKAKLSKKAKAKLTAEKEDKTAVAPAKSEVAEAETPATESEQEKKA